MFRHSLILAFVGTTGLAAAEGVPTFIPPGTTAHYTVNGHTYGLHMPLTQPTGGATPAATVDTHVIFMNRCSGGCTMHNGSPNSLTDTTDLGAGNVSEFSWGDDEWQKVMSCMKNTFSHYNVTITDVDPGNSPHLEIITAGTSAEVGEQNGVLGVADYACSGVGQGCSTFHSNAIVYDFANESAYYAHSSNPDYQLYGASDICATAAQEIAHTWALDHVVDPTDPLTYASSAVIRQFKDAQKCGSDCQSGRSPLGLACTGATDLTSSHKCIQGGNTQDEATEITGLFGAATPDTTAPTVSITAPAANGSVMPGFAVTATADDDRGIDHVDLTLDGTSLGPLNFAPFKWTAPMTLTKGPHQLVATATDFFGNTKTANVTVAYGKTCAADGDCDSGQVCDDGVCVAGPSQAGGLGATCTGNSDCESMECGSDGTSMFCVTSCDPTNSGCPSNFQCLQSGSTGVCWPGESGGGGGCSTSGNANAPLFLLGFGALFLVRRRRS
ncbi:MAG: Ig-like domain-containing protein [Kofleriaceae bacterium]